MSLTLYDPDQREFLGDILLSLSPAGAMRPEYHVGEYDLTELVLEAEWGRPDDERPAQELTLRVKQSIDPDEIRNESVYVYLNIGDVRIRQFAGRVLGVTAGRARTEIRAVTGGYWLDKQRFPATVSYANVAPSDVVYDCVSRMSRYDLSWMDLEEIPGPKLKADGSSLFDKRSKLADPIGAAVSAGQLFFADSAYNAPVLTRDRSPAEALEILHEYVVGEDINPDEFLPEVAGDEYYSVVATRDSGGLTVDLFEPVLVPDSTAPVDAVYEIEVTDDTATATSDAYTLAVQAANRFAMGGATVSFTVKWIHPLMVDGDFISIVEPFEHGERSGTRHWVAKVIRQRKTNELTHLFESVEMVRTGITYEDTSKVGALANGRGHRFPTTSDATALYPSETLYPSDTLYPGG